MKKLLIVVLAITLAMLFSSSCGRSERAMDREIKKEAIYHRGYEVGYEEGMWEGRIEAQEDFEQTAEDIAWDARKLCELDPEQAIWILSDYADGQPVTKQELYDAIWTIQQYYYDMQEAIYDIGSYTD